MTAMAPPPIDIDRGTHWATIGHLLGNTLSAFGEPSYELLDVFRIEIFGHIRGIDLCTNTIQLRQMLIESENGTNQRGLLFRFIGHLSDYLRSPNRFYDILTETVIAPRYR